MKANKGIIERSEDTETFIVIPLGFCDKNDWKKIYKNERRFVVVGTKKEFRKKFGSDKEKKK